MKSISDILFSKQTIENRGIYFFDNSNEYIFMSYKDIFSTCMEKLFVLNELGIRKGNEVIFQINDNRNFVLLYWACIMGGIVPVPLTLGINNEQINKLRHVYKLLGNTKIVLNATYKEQLTKEFYKDTLSTEDSDIINNMIVVEEIKTISGKHGIADPGKDEDIAFIQFSSGSTDMAKGVMLSHKNLLTNIEDILERGDILDTDFSLSWLPLTHDLGMIGFHLTPMFKGINFMLMETTLFIQKPMLWMETCNKFKISITSSPNFGYKYFLSKLKNNDLEWDLSNIRLIFNGAEPIDVEVALEFIRVLGIYGLQENVMYTVYGMAEACLGVTFPEPGLKMSYLTLDREKLQIGEKVSILNEGVRNGIKFVSNGSPLSRMKLRILDDEGNLLEQEKVGNIYIKGDNVTSGYYKNEKHTKENITNDGWLNTGDIGFIYNECLYITGRKKEIIILNGFNYYAHDIERICGKISDDARMQFVAAPVFEKLSNQEQLGIFVKYIGSIDKFKEIADRIKLELYRNSGIVANYVIPVKSIYKTTSGKLKRYEYTREFIDGKYDDVLEVLGKKSLENSYNKFEFIMNERRISQVIDFIKEELEVEEIDFDENLYNMGIDSLKLTKIHTRINQIIPNKISVSDFYSMPTVHDIIKFLETDESTYEEKNDVYEEIILDSELIDRIKKKAKELNIYPTEILYTICMYIHMFEKDHTDLKVNVLDESNKMLEKTFKIECIQSKNDLYKVISKQIRETGVKVSEIIYDNITCKVMADKTFCKVLIRFKNSYNEISAKKYYENCHVALKKI